MVGLNPKQRCLDILKNNLKIIWSFIKKNPVLLILPFVYFFPDYFDGFILF